MAFHAAALPTARAVVAELLAGGDVAPLADRLVDALDEPAATIEPIDPPLRWGATADLVAVLVAARQRADGLDPATTWAATDALVDALRVRRPHPESRPTPILDAVRRSTCCEWYRAGEARCADCPSLTPAANRTRLAALAAIGGLADP